MITAIEPGLKEYSVVFTDRSLNHMSAQFQQTMQELHQGCATLTAPRPVCGPGGELWDGGRGTTVWPPRSERCYSQWMVLLPLDTNFEAIAPDHAPTVPKLTVKTAARKAHHRYH